MKTEEIDIVLAWVDGSDPVWCEKKKERMRQQGFVRLSSAVNR